MVALVVVAHARVPADDLGRFVDVVGVDLGRDERGGVAERAGVEDGGELAQHAVGLDLRDALAHLGLADAEALAERRVGSRLEGKVPLHGVEELAVEIVELVLIGPCGQLHSLGAAPPLGTGRRSVVAMLARSCPGRSIAAGPAAPAGAGAVAAPGRVGPRVRSGRVSAAPCRRAWG